ncbi:hypothetical protein GCM10027446_03710 [Angustibacter peucedani]
MAALPPPGTFRLYPFARPPLPAGPYTLTGEVSGLPGPVETMQTAFDVTAPRYALPPDQVLSTFPPASARGSFTSRLPQVVLRRRTLPWERSTKAADGTPLAGLTDAQLDVTTPRPWLALVLVAEGEGNLFDDVPVASTVTSPLVLGGDADVPKGTCLEVPESVVAKIFPALEDLPMLCHVREVDLRDTELALGDDDGWMAVVLCNRLPQAGTKYTACLVNLEGQDGELPVDPPVAPEYDVRAQVFDATLAQSLLSYAGGSTDASGMGLVQHANLVQQNGFAAGAPATAPAASAADALDATHAVRFQSAASTGAGWTTSLQSSKASAATEGLQYKAFDDLAVVGTGVGYVVPWHLVERTVRFPVLVSWSFTCTDAGDFQSLAMGVSSRLLGHVPLGPETPDGAPLPDGTPPYGAPTEPPTARPLPLVAPTGHVETAHETRRGEQTTAWFRGPLVPDPVQRTAKRDDGRYPLAHHSDQLRRVTPDGREDLTYAAAYEIGRLLALSQPSVVAALGRWRRERFSSALTAAVADRVAQAAPPALAALLATPDPYVDKVTDLDLGDLPGPPVPDDPRRAAGAGRRFARGLLAALGDAPEDVARAVPAAPPGFAVDEPEALFVKGRDQRLARGFALDVALDGDTAQVAQRLWAAPVATGERDVEVDRATARTAMEDLAAQLVETATAFERQRGRSFLRRQP